MSGANVADTRCETQLQSNLTMPVNAYTRISVRICVLLLYICGFVYISAVYEYVKIESDYWNINIYILYIKFLCYGVCNYKFFQNSLSDIFL